MRARNLDQNLKTLHCDTRLLLRRFRISLLAFATLLFVGGFAPILYYPDTGQRIGWAEALHATFMLMLAEPVIPLPEALGLQVLLFAIPLIGLAVAVDGILRFGLALFNRRERKEAWQVAIASTCRDHVVVCGLGKVSYRVVKELLQFGRGDRRCRAERREPILDDHLSRIASSFGKSALLPRTLQRIETRTNSFPLEPFVLFLIRCCVPRQVLSENSHCIPGGTK